MFAVRFSVLLALLPGCLAAQVVRITPLGLKTGELCFSDRAMILEDPTGIRMLYDPGVVVAGSTDPRLGTIHVTLLSHVHQDHIGIVRLDQNPNAATAACDRSFARVPTMPNSNLGEITVRKNAAFIATPASYFVCRRQNGQHSGRRGRDMRRRSGLDSTHYRTANSAVRQSSEFRRKTHRAAGRRDERGPDLCRTGET